MRHSMMAALLIGCASGTVDEGKGSSGSLSINSAEDVERACEENDPISVRLEVEFPATEPGCPWGEGDNLDSAQGVITARIEQTVTLDLPEDAIVCDIAFDFLGPSGGVGTPMEYDDNFWFTFNDVVLAGSYGPMVDEFGTEDGLPVYSWADIAGYAFEFDDAVPTFCLGEEDSLAICNIPPPETDGIMSLQFAESLVNTLSFTAVESGRYDFGFVTMGDNDADLDCAHETFTFAVDVPYVRL